MKPDWNEIVRATLANRMRETEVEKRRALYVSTHGNTWHMGGDPNPPPKSWRARLYERFGEPARVWIIEKLGGDPWPN